MNRTVGILAHVDAGKTTLCEQILYQCGARRVLGRVDHQNAFLDYNPIERQRGITIFSEQATVLWKQIPMTLVDTPGHWDFSPEMERMLGILDYAVLIISGTAGIQAHTKNLWRLLEQREIPTFIFLNKCDNPDVCPEKVLEEIRERFACELLCMSSPFTEQTKEQIAMLDEHTLERYLDGGLREEELWETAICAIRERRLFPVYTGSALRGDGVGQLLDGLAQLTQVQWEKLGPTRVRVYKIRHDNQGNRVTFGKVLSGTLHPKEELAGEKIHELRHYQGEKFTPADQVSAGELCAFTGISNLRPGDTVGESVEHREESIQPLICTKVFIPEELTAQKALEQLQMIDLEEPTLHVRWQPGAKEIQVDTMGEIQLEVLQDIVKNRFGWAIGFDKPQILYRETICNSVHGIGHYEPLRHYAEVHLRLEPGAPGSGIQFTSECSEDCLGGNWQRLIATHVMEKEHVGPLIGEPVTDIKVILMAGKSHLKHTEGGDFRQATYRAIRQGLFQAECVLLEPYLTFTIRIKNGLVGRILSDIPRLCAEASAPVTLGEDTEITGKGPAATMMGYGKEFIAITKGEGSFNLQFAGYGLCHNTQEVIEQRNYDRERDTENPADSIFCSHGAGYPVKWYQVPQYAHIQL